MLKRAGTVATGVTAGLLALSPLAYAGGAAGHGGGHDHEGNFEKMVNQQFSQDNDSKNENELVSVDNNNTQVPVQACNNNVPVNVLGVQVPVQDFANAIGFAGDEDGQGPAATSPDSCKQSSPQAQFEDNEK